jgi:hypothetical protein
MEVNRGAEIIAMPDRKGSTSGTIIQLVQQQVDEKMEFLLAGFKENIADALFEEMNSIEEQSALSHHFNIMRAMRVGDEQFRQEFTSLTDETWSTFEANFDESHLREPPAEIAELIRVLHNRSCNHYKVLMTELRRRFQTLLKRDIDRYPLYPDIYYKCFWQSLRELPLSYDERCFLVPLFNRFVMDRYGQVLAVANRTLIEFKIDITV